MASKPNRRLTVGDRVMYSRQWLQSCGFFSGPIPFAVGVVEAIDGNVATVSWDYGETNRSLDSILIFADDLHKEST